jgi:hypothetical protein
MASTEEVYNQLSTLLAASNNCNPCNPGAPCKETIVCFPKQITGSGTKTPTSLVITGSGLSGLWVAGSNGHLLCGGGGGNICCCPCCIVANVTAKTKTETETETDVEGSGTFIINLKDCCGEQTATLYRGTAPATCEVVGILTYDILVQSCNGVKTISFLDMKYTSTLS